MATKTKPEANHKAVNRIADVAAPATMKPRVVTFRLIGISPLLQNNPAAFIGKSEEGGLTVKKEYNDEEEARLRLYVDGENFCHPCEAVVKAAVAAAAGKKFGKLFATKALKGAVFVTETLAVIEDENGEPAKNYAIDRRSVVINKKSRVLRCRPSWKVWHIRIALEIDTAILSPEQVLDCLSLAGRIIGIGDYRPEKGGMCGRFRVELIG